jgi:hypothetical protein
VLRLGSTGSGESIGLGRGHRTYARKALGISGHQADFRPYLYKSCRPKPTYSYAATDLARSTASSHPKSGLRRSQAWLRWRSNAYGWTGPGCTRRCRSTAPPASRQSTSRPAAAAMAARTRLVTATLAVETELRCCGSGHTDQWAARCRVGQRPRQGTWGRPCRDRSNAFGAPSSSEGLEMAFGADEAHHDEARIRGNYGPRASIPRSIPATGPGND